MHELLRKWLDLPPGEWPPTHYALLGLRPGEGSAQAVEDRAAGRMDRLRAYQLAYPDEVTEGMNRLAEALAVLGDPVRRAVYDVKLGLAATESAVFPLARQSAPAPPLPGADPSDPSEPESFDAPMPAAEPGSARERARRLAGLRRERAAWESLAAELRPVPPEAELARWAAARWARAWLRAHRNSLDAPPELVASALRPASARLRDSGDARREWLAAWLRHDTRLAAAHARRRAPAPARRLRRALRRAWRGQRLTLLLLATGVALLLALARSAPRVGIP